MPSATIPRGLASVARAFSTASILSRQQGYCNCRPAPTANGSHTRSGAGVAGEERVAQASSIAIHPAGVGPHPRRATDPPRTEAGQRSPDTPNRQTLRLRRQSIKQSRPDALIVFHLFPLGSLLRSSTVGSGDVFRPFRPENQERNAAPAPPLGPFSPRGLVRRSAGGTLVESQTVRNHRRLWCATAEGDRFNNPAGRAKTGLP